jgi:hypothetical protein
MATKPTRHQSRTHPIRQFLQWHSACFADSVECPTGLPVARASERIIRISDSIERYLAEHPRAADTPKGICEWWIGGQMSNSSVADVQEALDYLEGLGRLKRTVLAGGAVVYSAAGIT